MTTLRRALPELTSLALVVATAAVGLLVAPALPERMILGWHVGPAGEVSLTRGPRLLGLTLIPALAAAASVGLRLARLAIDARSTPDVRVFEVLAHLLLAALALAQAWLVAANL